MLSTVGISTYNFIATLSELRLVAQQCGGRKARDGSEEPGGRGCRPGSLPLRGQETQ